MPRAIMILTSRISLATRRGALGLRSWAWLALCATMPLGACSSDSGAGPREEDSETADFRFSRPGTVRDLAVASAGGGTVTLRFTEVDDGRFGPADYEIRYRPTPMRNDWNRATVVRTGTCAAPLSGVAVRRSRTCMVEGLDGGRIDFQLVAFRRQGSQTVHGQLSNVVTAEPGRASAGTGAEALKVSGDNQTGEVGSELSTPLSVRVRDGRGRGLSGVVVNWSANGGGSVSSSATTTDGQGLAQVTRTLGTVPGEYRTTAQVAGSSSVEFRSTAGAGPVATVTVLPAELSLNVGDSATMTAVLEDQYGNPVSGSQVSWSSSDTRVAEVRPGGRVVGRAGGVASVTASVDGLVATSSQAPQAAATGGSTVRVNDESSNRAGSVVPQSGSGQTGTVGSPLAAPLVVEVRDARGTRMSGVTVQWEVVTGGGSLGSSSSETGWNGRASTTLTLGTVAGTNQVRARVAGGESAMFVAEARPGAPTQITVTPGSASVARGSTVKFEAVLRDQHGNSVDGTPTWSSSATSVATVNASGLASGVGAGSAMIRATSGSLVGQASLTVTSTATNPGTVSDLSVVGTTSSRVTLRFSAANDGAGASANHQIRYTTTPMGWGWGQATPVQTGSCAGAVAGTAPGATVTCTVEGLNAGASYDFQMVAYRGSLDVMAVFGNLSNIVTGVTGASSPTPSGTLTISPRGGTLTAIGSSLQLSMTARSSTGATVSNPSPTWTSSNTNVATVDGSGRVTARGIGTAIISVAASCCAGDQVEVTVTQAISSISVSPTSLSVGAGGTGQLLATARDANGNTVPNVFFVWNSSNTNVATVTNGVVTGIGGGTTTVTASAGGRSGSASVSVSASSPPPPSGGSGPTPDLPQINSFAFSSLQGSGWWVLSRNGRPTLETDSSAPVSASQVVQFNFPSGFPDGQDAGVAYTTLSATEVLVRLVFKVSPGWQHHTNNFKHVFFLTNGRRIYSNFTPGGYIGMINQNDDGIAGTPNIGSTCGSGCNRQQGTLPAAAQVRDGQWQVLEMHGRMNGDGTALIQWWVDGALIGRSERERVDATRFTEFNIVGTWGGGGSRKNRNDWIRYDHVTVYGR